MQGHLVEPSRRGRGDGCKAEYEQHISTHAVVFVYSLRVIHASIKAGGVILRYSHHSLNSEDDVGDESKDAVWGGEVGAGVGEFVVLDYYECGKKR